MDDRSGGNLQRERLLALLGNYDPITKSLVSDGHRLLVTAVPADRYGGLDIELSGGLRLQVLPSGAGGEDWRFFSPGDAGSHLVVQGGRVVEGW